MSRFYRFRTIDDLIGKRKEEIEKQSIYFARPDQLNDPMEGFRDVFWSGDSIAWNNLFKHYLLCLERLCFLLMISGEEYSISKNDIPIFSSEADLPTEKYRKLFRKISFTFFSNESIRIYINNISERTTAIRREELLFHLNNVHQAAIEAILSSYEDNNLIPKRENHINNPVKLIEKLLKNDFWGHLEKSLEENGEEEKIVDVLFSAQTHVRNQIELIQRYNGVVNHDTKNKNLVLVEFSEEYIKQIENLVFPEWYTACFMSECSNSAVWGHYGDKHSGVCLVFKPETKGEDHYITLETITGWGNSGPIYGPKKMKLYPINYIKGFGQIDFFRSLGRLPIPILESVWYSNENGEISECADDIFNAEEKWRQAYWDSFIRDITVKSEDWKYENEFRLILASSLSDYSDKNDRVLKYDFSSLEGLIFGINTTKENKLKIMKIIDDKCNETGRDDFKFYQAYYSPDKGCIEHKEMDLVRYTKKA